MAFTLNIEFMGLCLFVPDQPTPGLTSVLMPTAGGDVPPHVAMLAVDLAYLLPDQTATTGQYALLSLASAELSFQGLGTVPPPPPGQSPPIPAEIANVGEVVSKPIIPAVLGSDPSGYLNTRVVLEAGTCAPMQVECWRYPPLLGNRQLAQGAQWTIPGVNQDTLVLSPSAFGIAAAPLIPVLYPIPQTPSGQSGPPVPTIEVTICNTAVYELPIMPQALQLAEAGRPGSHFKALYSLFEMDILDPKWDPEPCGDAGSFGYGELPYTCMGPAQSVATPG